MPILNLYPFSFIKSSFLNQIWPHFTSLPSRFTQSFYNTGTPSKYLQFDFQQRIIRFFIYFVIISQIALIEKQAENLRNRINKYEKESAECFTSRRENYMNEREKLQVMTNSTRIELGEAHLKTLITLKRERTALLQALCVWSVSDSALMKVKLRKGGLHTFMLYDDSIVENGETSLVHFFTNARFWANFVLTHQQP